MKASPARLGALWFGIQATWSAVLGVALQARSEQLDPAHGVSTYATVATAGAVVATVVQLGAGAWSDRTVAVTGHRRHFYAGGVGIALAGLLLLFAAPSVALFVSAFALLQIGMNLANGPYQAAVPDHVEPEREGRASAWMGALSSAGAVAGLLVAVTTSGMVTAVALAVILAIACGVTYLHVRQLPPIVGGSERRPHLDRDTRTLLASRGAVFLGFYTLFGFLFFFLRETLGVTDARTTTGVVFLAFTIAAILGAMIAARPTDRYDKRLVVSIAGACIIAGVLVFACAPALPVAISAAVVCGAAWGAFTTADWAIAFEVLPRGTMATAMGVWNLAVTIPQIVAPLVTAPLVNAFDRRHAGLGPRAALCLVALEFAVGTAWLWRLRALRGYGARRERVQPSPSRS